MPDIKNKVFETNWVVSGAHLTEADMVLMESASVSESVCPVITTMAHSGGTYVSVGPFRDEVLDVANEVGRYGFSKEFANLLRIASSLGVSYIKFDRDCLPYPELPIMEES